MVNKQNSGVDKGELIEKQVKIIRKNPDQIKPIYVNDFLVTHSDQEFFLMFSIVEPVHVSSQDELINIDSVDAIARVKLALTPSFVRKVSIALNSNIIKFDRRLDDDSEDRSESD